MSFDPPPHPTTRKARTGCLGCLGQVGLVLLLGLVLSTALIGVFYPWAFYLGGKFHIIPCWQGVGRAHAKSGDYVVWVQFEPTTRSSGLYRTSNLTGLAYVCTPRAEKLRMHLRGGMRKNLNLSTDREAINLYMDYRPTFFGQLIGDRRPHLEFRGKWQNPNIVMDDHGSIGRAFEANGTVYRGHGGNHPYIDEVVPITFVNEPRSEFDKACAELRK